jgi:autotransporter-associated beta strand protein
MKTKTPLQRTTSLFALALLATFAVPQASAQFNLTGSNYTQDFNTLPTNTTNGVLNRDLENVNLALDGWYFFNAGSVTNANLIASTGTSTTGGNQNLGLAGNTDRSLGGLSVNNTVPSWGFWFSNSVGATITNLQIVYKGETWRVSVTSRSDSYSFSYSGTNTSLAASTWTNDNSLGYTNVATNATGSGSLLQSATISNNLAVNITNGGTFFLRWLDVNISGNDDALSMDDFSLTAFYSSVIAGTYWAPAAGGGGSGTWSSSSGDTVWATAAGTQGTGPQAATGTLIFGNNAGTVTVSGAVTAVAGLQFSSDGYTVTGGTSVSLTGANAAANTITTDANVGATINSVLAGANGMTKAGNGTLTLGGANTYTGGTLVSGGRLSGDTTSLRGNITNNAALTFNQSTNGTYSDAISGNGSVVKSGSGSVSLSGTSSYSGGTAVSGGTLVGDTRSLQGAITNTAAVSFNQSTNGTYAGVLSGSGGTVTKSGAGTVTFTQNNTYTGATTVDAGRLVVNGSQSSSAVTVNSGGASLAGSGTVGALTVSGLLAPGTSVGTLNAGSTTFNGGGALELEIFDWVNSAGTGWDLLAITGDLTLNNTSVSPFTINLVSLQSTTTPGLSIDWDQNLSFTNTFITYSGSLLGTSFASDLFSVNTSGFQNTVNGTFSITNVSGGLALLYTTAFVPASEYIWNTGAGAWGTPGSWSGGIAPSNNSAIVFSGGGGASTNNLVNTVQSLLFSNTAGSYTVSGDALTVGALGVDNESTAAQTINIDLTLGAAQTFLAANGDLTFGGTVNNGGFLLTVAGDNDTAINGSISGAGGLTKNGAGSLTLAGANSYAGGTTVNAGTLVGSTTSLQGNIANASFLEFNQAGDGSYVGAISGAGVVTKSGAGNVTFSGANTYNGGTIVSGGTLTGSTATVPGDVDVNSGATFALSQTTNGTFSGLIEGAGRFVKSGSGDVTLSGANTYSGGTLVSGGTLTGTTSSLQGNITNNAAVVFNQTTAGTYADAMSGNGSLTKSGNATLTLSGANSYSGGTLVSAGALAGSTTSLQGNITNNATVVLSQTTNGSYSGAMSGSGALVKAGSGTVTLGGNSSSYNGAIDLQDGGLIAANNNALGSSAVTMTNGSIQAANGVSIANNFTIGSAPQTSYGSSVSLAGWDFSTIAAGTAGNANNFGPSPFSGTYDAAVTSSGLVRPNGHTATNTGVAGAWGGNDWQATSAAQAVTDEDYVTFTLKSSSNLLALDSIIAYNVRRSSTGATSGQWQYSTNGATFTDIGSVITWGSTTTATGNAQSAISLSNISGLQGIAEGTTVTFRILTYGGTAQAGTWYLKDLGNGTTNDFGVVGKLGTFIAGSGSGALGIGEAGAATFSGNIANNSAATLTAATGGTAIFSGALSGLGTVTKTGAGTVTLSGASANTFSGMTTVSAGTLQLSKSTDVAAIAGNITVNTGATLLLSSSGNVANTSAVTLSGGTILRDGGVSEVFGALTLGVTGGTLDFGTGATGTLGFGEYAPSALLTINNFFQGNTLTFGSDLSGSINNASLFSFDNGFTSNWSSGTSTFTITAIPEPSTYLAAAGLLSLMLWPSRKRILRDAKKILGFTPPMRDRLAARQKA